MKKLLSLALVVFMVMSLCVTAVVPASAEATKVFSLDLSDGTVKNGVADSNSTITGGNGSTIETVAETGTKVLDIGTKGYAVTDQNIKDLASRDFTVEWWAKADNAVFSGWMGSFRNNSSNQYSFKSQNISTSNSQWRTDRHYVPTGETEAKEINVPIPASTCSDYTAWNHFAITDSYDSSTSTGTVTVYLNGKQAATGSYTGTRVAIDTLNIGQAHADAAYFAGFIGAFDVYSGALSATEIAANYKSSIKDYYDLDESGLLFDLDLSGYDKNSTDAAKGIKDKTKDMETETLTLASSLDIQSEKLGDRTVNVMNLKQGQQGGINAVDSAVNTAASDNTLTLESWMKIDSSNNEHYFLYSNGSHNWQVMVKNSGTTDLQFVDRAHNQASDQVEFTHTASEVRSTWAHYVFTREYTTSGLVQKLYVNGELVSANTASNSATTPHSTNGYTMYIGGGNFAGDNGIAMNGQIATFKVYKQALTAAEVSETYAKELDTYYDLDKSGLLFDLDLSGYDASSADAAKGIKDKTKDLTEETISLVGSATVTKLSEDSDVNVLNINTSDKKGGIDAKDTAVDEAASGKTMTVESWMKVDDIGSHYLLYSTPSNAHNWQLMFGGVDKADTKDVNFTTKLHNSDAYMTKDVLAHGTCGEWAHYVFTRKYTDSGCVQKLFVNGVLAKEYTSSVTAQQTVTNGIMYIGGGSYASNGISMNGSIATFKVYNKALTAAEAKAKFAAEASTYGVTVLTDVSISGDVAWKSGDDTISAIGSDTKALSAGFTLKNNTAAAETVFCALALYDADGNLVKCAAEDNISLAAGATADKTLSLTELTVGDGYSAKLLVWKSGTLQPYFTAVTITSAGTGQVCL